MRVPVPTSAVLSHPYEKVSFLFFFFFECNLKEMTVGCKPVVKIRHISQKNATLNPIQENRNEYVRGGLK